MFCRILTAAALVATVTSLPARAMDPVAADPAPIVNACVQDLTSLGREPTEATTACTCSTNFMKERLTVSEFNALVVIVPIMTQMTEPTPESINNMLTQAGLTQEQFDALGTKISAIGPEADKTCGT